MPSRRIRRYRLPRSVFSSRAASAMLPLAAAIAPLISSRSMSSSRSVSAAPVVGEGAASPLADGDGGRVSAGAHQHARHQVAGDFVAADDRQPLDDVGELAHVARPRMARQRGQRFGGEVRRMPRAQPRREMLDQIGNVAQPLAKRRHLDREHVEAEIEVLAERAGRRPRLRAGDWSRRAPGC